MFFKSIVKMFENGSVSVSGLRGTGKDVLTSNVVARRDARARKRRKKGMGVSYVSNVPYGFDQFPFDYSNIDVGGNTWENLLTGNILPYDFPYPDGTDFFLSDAGIMFPSQYDRELNSKYPNLPLFLALSRHLGLCQVHVNSQNPSRVWNKIREQSDLYINCRWCKVFHLPFLKKPLFVLQLIRIYDKYESFEKAVPPYPKKLFKGFGTKREIYEQQKRTYLINYGTVKQRLLLYIHKGQYDTRYFKKLLAGGDPFETYKENFRM